MCNQKEWKPDDPNKMGSLIYFEMSEGECDLCITDVQKEINKWVREDFPEWFEKDGQGNLINSELYLKKLRTELAKKVEKQKVLKFICGFCSEPFGICDFHLSQIRECKKCISHYN